MDTLLVDDRESHYNKFGILADCLRINNLETEFICLHGAWLYIFKCAVKTMKGHLPFTAALTIDEAGVSSILFNSARAFKESEKVQQFSTSNTEAFS